MRLLKCIVVNLVFIFFVSCQKEAMHVKLAHQSMFSFAYEVKKTDDLILFGYGGGMYGGTVNQIYLCFISKKNLSVDEAREYYFEITDRFLKRINCDEALCPFLAHHPFTLDEFELMILFQPDLGPWADPYVAAVAMDKSYSDEKKQFFFIMIDDPVTNQTETIMEPLHRTYEKLRYQEHCRLMLQELAGTSNEEELTEEKIERECTSTCSFRSETSQDSSIYDRITSIKGAMYRAQYGEVTQSSN